MGWCDPVLPAPSSEGGSLGIQARIDQAAGGRSGTAAGATVLSPSGEADRLTRALTSSMGADGAAAATSMYNSRDPVQALANMESMTVEAVFILKDFHRHMDDPVVVRRLRDVGQKFSANRRTVIITAPELSVPPELAKLVEYLRSPAAGSRAVARDRATRRSRGWRRPTR